MASIVAEFRHIGNQELLIEEETDAGVWSIDIDIDIDIGVGVGIGVGIGVRIGVGVGILRIIEAGAAPSVESNGNDERGKRTRFDGCHSNLHPNKYIHERRSNKDPVRSVRSS